MSRVGAVEHIHVLTSLRFVPAIWVVLHHFGVSFLPDDWVVGRRFLETGATGVTFFFVLSGFILAVNYPVERLKVKSFLIARFARVYPLYFLAALISVPFLFKGALKDGWLAAAWETLIQGFLSVFLLQAWFPNRATALNPASWSLSAEAFFYAAFVPLLLWRSSRRLIDKTLFVSLLLWVIAILPPLLWILYHPGVIPSPGLPGPVAWKINLVSFHPLIRLPEFILGVALGRAHLQGWRLRFPIAVLITATVLVSFAVVAVPIEWAPLIHNGLPAPIFGLIIIGAAQAKGSLINWLSRPVPVFLGESSYALYILHMPVYYWLRWVSGRAGIDTESIAWHVLYFAVAIGVASAAYVWIENPARRRIRSWMDSRVSGDQPQRDRAGINP